MLVRNSKNNWQSVTIIIIIIIKNSINTSNDNKIGENWQQFCIVWNNCFCVATSFKISHSDNMHEQKFVWKKNTLLKFKY